MMSFTERHAQSIQIVAAFRAQPSLRHRLPRIADDATFAKLFAQIERYQELHTIKNTPAEFLAVATFDIIVNYCNAQLANEAYAPKLDRKAISQMVRDLLLIQS